MPPRPVSVVYERRLEHLTEVETIRYARGGAEEAEKSAVEQHIAACSMCLQKLRIVLRHPS
jgi:hypothetical protein